MPAYPTLRLLDKHGEPLAIAAAACPIVAAAVAIALSASWWWLVVAVVAAAFMYLAAKSYIELVRLMIDMLLPK